MANSRLSAGRTLRLRIWGAGLGAVVVWLDYRVVDGKFEPVTCIEPCAPQGLLELTKCSCMKRRCAPPCRCNLNNLPCTEMCSCGGNEDLCDNTSAVVDLIMNDNYEDEDVNLI